jgi:hypothetical protein
MHETAVNNPHTSAAAAAKRTAQYCNNPLQHPNSCTVVQCVAAAGSMSQAQAQAQAQSGGWGGWGGE